MGPICCPEKTVSSKEHTARNIPKGRRPQLDRDASLKSQKSYCDPVLTNFMCRGIIYIIHVICLLTPRVDVGARNLLPQFLNHNFPTTPRTNITVTSARNRSCQLWHGLSPHAY